jgi:hypothetical protein
VKRGKEAQRGGRPDSMGYQLLQVLKTAFQPGTSRYQAKQRGEAEALIFGIETIWKYTAEAFELAGFLKEYAPQCRRPEDITLRCARPSWSTWSAVGWPGAPWAATLRWSASSTPCYGTWAAYRVARRRSCQRRTMAAPGAFGPTPRR